MITDAEVDRALAEFEARQADPVHLATMAERRRVVEGVRGLLGSNVLGDGSERSDILTDVLRVCLAL